MKLISFKADGVYGYLRFDVNFNNNLSFLVGSNGCGKTTVLKLIQAVLTPNLKDIYLIPFSSINLVFEKDNKKHQLKFEKNKQEITVILDNMLPEKLVLDNITNEDELSYILSKEENLFNRKLFEHKNNPVFKFIHEVEVPLFLGLDRRENAQEDNMVYREQFGFRDGGERRPIRRNRYIDGSLGQSLHETQDIVRSVYEKIRRKEDIQRKKLRDDILLTSFHFAEIKDLFDENGGFKSINIDEQKSITTKKEAISQALKNIGFDRDKNIKQMDDFFVKIESLFLQMQQNQANIKGLDIAWLINKSQVDRIQKLIELIDESNAKVKESYESLNKFTNTINHFLKDTGKSIDIDNIGVLKIKKPNGQSASIDALSSGERQLIVMFSHLIFKNESNPSGVFIIDEPELSLHLKWQEEFVEYAINSNPNTQLILATHSPEIFSGFEENVIQVSRM